MKIHKNIYINEFGSGMCWCFDIVTEMSFKKKFKTAVVGFRFLIKKDYGENNNEINDGL